MTPNFLASDFIAENELPPLLEAAKKEGVTVLWVAVSASAHQATDIGKYQAANNPKRPLDTLDDGEQNRVLVDVCDRVVRAMKA